MKKQPTREKRNIIGFIATCFFGIFLIIQINKLLFNQQSPITSKQTLGESFWSIWEENKHTEEFVYIKEKLFRELTLEFDKDQNVFRTTDSRNEEISLKERALKAGCY